MTGPPADAVVRTPRLDLRFVTAGDLPVLHALDNDPEVMRYTNGGLPITMAQYAREILPVLLARDPQHPAFGFRLATERDSGEALGWFGVRSDGNSPSVARLSYRTRKAVWGRGLGTEAASALVDVAFGMSGMRQVVATVYEDNVASVRVAEKLGMCEVRRFAPSEESPAAMDTYRPAPASRWPGQDIEFAISRQGWLAQRGRQAR